MADGKKENAAATDTEDLTDNVSLPIETQTTPDAENAPFADDSLIGDVAVDADIPVAQIDATLDLLASTPDIADLPALDWDLPG